MPVLESVVDRETQLACQIHGHRVLLLRNLRAEVSRSHGSHVEIKVNYIRPSL